jgi:Phosphotransferase enzyme family
MTITATEELPGGMTALRLQDELRQALARPELVVDRITCIPIDHRITAPSTCSLTHVAIGAHDGEPLHLRLVAKVLQPALYGLPVQIPAAERERIAARIPWRLEWEVYTGDTAARMPAGMRLPRLYAAVEHPDDRISLWLEDVDPLDEPWPPEILARAATGLGRLTPRLADQHLATRPDTTFLAHLVADAVRRWAIPLIDGDDLWAHPAFAQPPVADLRGDLLALAERVDGLFASLSSVPCLNTHGDPTPMNLLRPLSAPDEFVLIDWGTAALGPVGWDLVPLVFGPAENGTAAADDLADRLAIAVPAFVAGLADEGMELPEPAVAAAVRTCALLRYPLTSLPLSEVVRGDPLTEELGDYARRKAAFVRAVLDVCR